MFKSPKAISLRANEVGLSDLSRHSTEKYLTVETLNTLHNSIETCPTENDVVGDPKGLNLPLKPHQKSALAWLLWREKQNPSGGILADDMGLGKTLTMISLVLKSKEVFSGNRELSSGKYPGGTLVVCPASLINQWSGEVETKTGRGLLSVEVYHGAKRETNPKRLSTHDIVITTYTLVLKEKDKNGALFGVHWRRIILDEAHQMRNHASRTSEAICQLPGKSRWASTGTPVHNKELDIYSLLKFLRCSPFDDLKVWKQWIEDKGNKGQKRLPVVVSSMMLRRTKAELVEKGALQNLPEKSLEVIEFELDKEEMEVYQKVLKASRPLVAQYLHKNGEKIEESYVKSAEAPRGNNKNGQGKILVLLLRLRQICCHLSLIKQISDAEEKESEELKLLSQLNKLSIHDTPQAVGRRHQKVSLKEAPQGFMNTSSSVFREDRPSSKIKALLTLLREKVAKRDKAIVVSQWTSFLRLISIHMKKEGLAFDSLDGTIPVNKRMAIVDNFNNPHSQTKVLLLSLTAGGVGLNLIGANHLFLLDPHWNPQLESQAQDRIYRMGQEKSVFVYKFVVVKTVEKDIKDLQDKKLEIANSMLTKSKQLLDDKLSLQDLKMLFDFK